MMDQFKREIIQRTMKDIQNGRGKILYNSNICIHIYIVMNDFPTVMKFKSKLLCIYGIFLPSFYVVTQLDDARFISKFIYFV